MLDTDRRGADPRTVLPPDELFLASLRAAPQVAQPRRRGDGLTLVAGALGALALGAFTLLSLSQHRTEAPPAVVADAPATETVTEPIIAQPPFEPLPEMPIDAPAPATEARALPMVIDNSAGTPANVAASDAPEATGPSENRDEGFMLRAGNDSAAGPARAERLGDPSHTVVQGAIIPAVLETALNSEMPGFARAIVSRDVRSFDGGGVLIPRGSRLVGQYRASSAPGQTRVFVMWSRLIRPDGVSIQLTSPALDANGAAGVSGDVDTHFFQNFGRSLLLSIVGALPAAAGAGSSTVIIGGSAAQTAAQATQSDTRIAPTIRVPIGTPIQVFTARDLSFE